MSEAVTPDGDGGAEHYCAELAIRRIEKGYVEKRREKLDLPLRAPAVGLALSGGGIRSATFSLGVLRALSRERLIRRIDYLSTVSGGGYAGAFYCSLFSPTERRQLVGGGDDIHSEEDEAFVRAEDPLGHDRGKRGLEYLRQCGRYLLPGQSGDIFRIMTIAVRNWAALHIVIGISLIALFLMVKVIQGFAVACFSSLEISLAQKDIQTWVWPTQWLYGYPAGSFLLSFFWPLAGLCLIVYAFINWSFWLTRTEAIASQRLRRLLSGGTAGTLLIALMSLWLMNSVAMPMALKVVLGFVCAAGFLAIVTFLVAENLDFDAPPGPSGFIAGLKTALVGIKRFGTLVLEAFGLGDENELKRSLALSREHENNVRSAITAWAAWWLGLATILAVLALIDTAGSTFYERLRSDAGYGSARLTGIGIGFAGVMQVLRWLFERIQSTKFTSSLIRRFGHLFALGLGIILATMIAIFWSSVAHYIAWNGNPVGFLDDALPTDDFLPDGIDRLAILTLCFAGVAIGFGVSFGFLNLSSFASFYASRLRRAYLGASNTIRTKMGIAPDRDHAADDVALQDYFALSDSQLRGEEQKRSWREMLDTPVDPADSWMPPKGYRPEHSTGAPLHLINCTINQTRGEGSQLVQRDRKGRPLTLSPAGHLFPSDPDPARRVRIPFSVKASLPLSTWIGISGAAFSTALGQQTSLGLSLLAGIANLRLGHWWRPAPTHLGYLILRPSQWIQNYLSTEFRAAYRGISEERLYLTDGGHFENTGIYELVRRHVPFIIACDNGADPDYSFSDIVNLMRKLRIDLNAELDFLPAAYLDKLFAPSSPQRRIFGELTELRRYSKENKSWGPYAALGRIRVRDENGEITYCGTLILIKPRLTGMELADLLDYHRSHEDFPQQNTTDQFFDEAQWESYYCLAQRVIELIFSSAGSSPSNSWSPSSLKRIDPAVHPWIDENWPVGSPATSQGVASKKARKFIFLWRAR